MPKQITIDNAIKLLGEAALPGASLLMDGKIAVGGLHLIAGAWAKAAIGPVGTAIVVANSYSQSVTGKSLLKHLTELGSEVSALIPRTQATADAGSNASASASNGASAHTSPHEQRSADARTNDDDEHQT